MSKTPDCLVGAGAMGHTWCVTQRSKETGAERLYAQCSCGVHAAQAFNEYPEQSVAIYQRKARGWKKVSLGFAASMR